MAPLSASTTAILRNEVFINAPQATTEAEAWNIFQERLPTDDRWPAIPPLPSLPYTETLISLKRNRIKPQKLDRHSVVDKDRKHIKKSVVGAVGTLDNEARALLWLSNRCLPAPKLISCRRTDRYVAVLEREYIPGVSLQQRLHSYRNDESAAQALREGAARKVADLIQRAQAFEQAKMSSMNTSRGAKIIGSNSWFPTPMKTKRYMFTWLDLYSIPPNLQVFVALMVTHRPIVLAHGNLSPKNVIIKKNGEVVLIGWEHAGFYFKGYESAMILLNSTEKDVLWERELLKCLGDQSGVGKLVAYCKILRDFGAPHFDPHDRDDARRKGWLQLQELCGIRIDESVGKVDYRILHHQEFQHPFWRELKRPGG